MLIFSLNSEYFILLFMGTMNYFKNGFKWEPTTLENRLCNHNLYTLIYPMKMQKLSNFLIVKQALMATPI